MARDQYSRKWMVLVATTWIQAFTGTNFDFSSYSTELKSVLGISQVQLNYLSMASDMGKAFGWCAGLSLFYFPSLLVLFMAAILGLSGYGLQWLLIHRFISLPYILAFLLCLSAGCSISWFNTVCFVLCIKNFPTNRPLALSLSVSFNGVSAALYNLIANAINSNDNSIYLLLNAFLPFLTSIMALVPILCQSPSQALQEDDNIHFDPLIFLFLYILAAFTGLYLLLQDTVPHNASVAHMCLLVAIFLLVLPLITPRIVYAREWARQRLPVEGLSFNLVDVSEWDPHKELMESETDSHCSKTREVCWPCDKMLEKDRLMVLNEEHSAKMLVRRWDFWLYYVTYFCGGTIGLVYSNNLGQISQSLGYSSQTNALVMLYSTCSFFGRLLSAVPDLVVFLQPPHTRTTRYTSRTGWLALSLVPMPIAFLLLVLSSSEIALSGATGLIGLSSGFIFSAAVSITSELFGSNNAGVNHNILITNIPLGSLFYGLVAALVYDNHIENLKEVVLVGGSNVCMGRKCYFETFVCWGCISLLGVASSSLLFLRTKEAYDHFERSRNRTQFSQAISLSYDDH